MSETKRINAGFEIVASCPLLEKKGYAKQRKVCIGRKRVGGTETFCTWESNENGYFWGHYDYKTFEQAYKDMLRRVNDDYNLGRLYEDCYNRIPSCLITRCLEKKWVVAKMFYGNLSVEVVEFEGEDQAKEYLANLVGYYAEPVSKDEICKEGDKLFYVDYKEKAYSLLLTAKRVNDLYKEIR